MVVSNHLLLSHVSQAATIYRKPLRNLDCRKDGLLGNACLSPEPRKTLDLTAFFMFENARRSKKIVTAWEAVGFLTPR